MKGAYAAVKSDEYSVRDASIMFGIPYSTLHDRVTGKVQFGSHSGPRRFLDDAEETELVNFLCGAASMGFARSKKEVICIVEEVLAAKGTPKKVSNGWWESFCGRHPQLCIRTAEKLSYARLKATDPVVLDRYFDLLETTLEEYDLFEAPSRIFNCDETGLCYQHKSPCVVGIKGQHHPRAVTTGNKRQVTVMACANAAGYYIPPFAIFKRKTLPLSVLNKEVPGTRYALSDSGWMDSETFDNWFSCHFLVHAPSTRPLVLLLDGHSSHYNYKFIEKASYERIIVFCLPPNTTHLCQPLDKGIFGPLKTCWNDEVHHYLRKHPGEVMNDFSFNQVFSQAWGRSMTIPNATAAFRTTGVYPFSRTAIHATESVQALTKSSGLHYIPILSPAPQRRSRHMVHEAMTTDYQYADASIGDESQRESEGLENLLLGEIPIQQTVISRFFPDIQPDLQLPRTYENTATGRILTGPEFMKQAREKEQKKIEKKLDQERKKKEREMKKQSKMQEQNTKKQKVPTTRSRFISSIHVPGCYHTLLLIERLPAVTEVEHEILMESFEQDDYGKCLKVTMNNLINKNFYLNHGAITRVSLEL